MFYHTAINELARPRVIGLSTSALQIEVSVIVPAYNYASFLPQCVESISLQTMSNWECIVIDDASTDNTRSVLSDLRSAEPRVRSFVQPTNQGPSAARNRGLTEAKGRFIQFLDADDRLQNHKLEAHATFLREHLDTDIVYGNTRFFRSGNPERLMASLHGTLSEQLIAPISGAGEHLVDLLSHHSLMPINAALIRREVFELVGGFEEAMRGCEDWDWFLRCAILRKRFAYHAPAGTSALVRSHAGSASRDQMRLLNGLAIGADRFPQTLASLSWQAPTLPPMYEAALGIREVQQGKRWVGARRLRLAARIATRFAMRIRWQVYSLAALTTPQFVFRWLVSRPMPEWPLELSRRALRWLSRSPGRRNA